MAENDPEAGAEAEAQPAKLGMMQLIMVAGIAAVCAVGATVLTNALMPPAAAPAEGEEEGAEAVPPAERGVANYLPLDPALVVNLTDRGQSRFLQTTVQIMTHDEEVYEAAKVHSPAIRAALIMLFGTVDYASVSTREGKEQLQEQARQVADDVLLELAGTQGIDELYLTSFVVQ